VNDDGFQVAISRVLRIGVTVSAVLIATGFIGSFLVGWEGSLRDAAPGVVSATAFTQIRTGLLELRPIAITQLGLLVLIATPVVRVAVSVVGFARERDALYVAITLAVLAILLASLFLVR
jgi:uncharacterized membrane protein